MVLTFVSVVTTPELKEESLHFPELRKIFPYMQEGRIREQILSSKFEQNKYIQFPDDKSSLIGILQQKLIFEDGRTLYRTIDIRYDDSKHNKTETHYNIYLTTSYPDINKKKTHALTNCHNIKILKKKSQALHILISSGGRSIRRTIVYLPTETDKKYYEEQMKFFDKVKSGVLTQKDKENFKKQFDYYSDYLTKN